MNPVVISAPSKEEMNEMSESIPSSETSFSAIANPPTPAQKPTAQPENNQ